MNVAVGSFCDQAKGGQEGAGGAADTASWEGVYGMDMESTANCFWLGLKISAQLYHKPIFCCTQHSKRSKPLCKQIRAVLDMWTGTRCQQATRQTLQAGTSSVCEEGQDQPLSEERAPSQGLGSPHQPRSSAAHKTKPLSLWML